LIRRSPRSSIALLFGLTIFASACLLFLVQPLASKLILPWFGGSAAVWITCMLFFQAGLLLGYLYAHALASRLSPKRQAALHSALLLLSLATLPILPNAMWQPHPGEDPTWRVLGALATAVGAPYLLLASTSPLLQSWYAGINAGALPYRYFALSNAGSLIALLSYPVLFEPHLSSHQQVWIWSIGFAVFAALAIATAVTARRRAVVRAEPNMPERARPRMAQLILWLTLPACASALLLAVTNLLTQNIAPMPLLWVVPLSTYLLTFMLCFESDRWYKRIIFLPLVFPALGCLAAAIGPLTNRAIYLEVPLFTAALFVCSMACHGELARLKPPSELLTTFYLWLAAGGAIGGLFVALLAPHVFRAMYELPIALVSCPLLLVAVLWRERSSWRKPDLGLSVWLAALATSIVLAGYAGRETWFRERFATRLARNFYGALRVDEFEDHHQKIRELTHGTITHGIQFLNPNLRHIPTTYYAWESGAGLAWQALAESGSLRMGVVGLGAGTLAAYGRGGDTVRFYEINPAVIEIAKTQFTYLADCPAHLDLVLGDARLSMAHEPDQRFDLLVIDAFSGDAIPIHLLTREAFRIYWRHLKRDGVLAVHVSNHYLNLAPIVKLAALDMHKEAWQVDAYDNDAREAYTSTYVLVSNRAGFFDNPLFMDQLIGIDAPRGLRMWTDDYSNLWQVLTIK
jgi:hypothetical protein